MLECEKLRYEDCEDIIDESIARQKSKWKLDSLAWISYDDISQVIRFHIFKKWHLWNQERPLRPWIGRIISNQIKNLVRNNYGNFIKPCITCPHSNGEGCNMTKTGKQDVSCDLFARWNKTRRYALEIKTPSSTELFPQEMGMKHDNNFNFSENLASLDSYMKSNMNPTHYRAYQMLFFEDSSEEDVAIFMGYKISEEKRKTGYRQVKNLKRQFKELALKALYEEKILSGD